MQKVLIIDGGKKFGHSGGRLNHTIKEWDLSFFTPENGFDVKTTNIEDGYVISDEIEKWVWADIIVYHFAIWWMYLPFPVKEYLDRVLTAGHRKGMYYSDGRKSENPTRNYGTGGSMEGRQYMVTTTWNAPEDAFRLPDEFFKERSVDDGVLFPFHRMNAFLSLKPLESFHFHDVEKNFTDEKLEKFHTEYLNHLNKTFLNK
ncbi:NAD(P)H-dependent oxidoreductase [Rhizosphaericola mali]|uniref:NAD(P)H-dependent oxidoreductase n=1 Tax=Rhizosphaericola mali TaxID=2545455 RepID=A0A5P2FZ35_9BACT|nr:NAD(P)H-dependent oxidoreductase [Rhizosphaericola mali]QES88197.1 NAD(P)H-dependent oxidoreductase [Rhizosphaericola mali]